MSTIQLTDEQQDILALARDQPRMLISAPPGCGKTTLILYLLEQWQELKEVKPHKSILLMSFSTSAANKIKLELQQKANESENADAMNYFLKEKTVTTNYHGLCRRILFKQRASILTLIEHTIPESADNYDEIKTSLEDMQKLQGIDTRAYGQYLQNNTAVHRRLSEIDNLIKSSQNNLLTDDDIKLYAESMIRFFLPNEVISFNGIIILVLYLFLEDKDLLNKYRSYFTHIIVDEFQDSNILAYKLLDKFLNEEESSTNVKFYGFGDELQQIYNFIGAISNIFEQATQNWGCVEKELTINQRYKNNTTLLEVSEFIRDIAKRSQNPAHLLRIPNSKIDQFDCIENTIDYIKEVYKTNSCCVLFGTRSLQHSEPIEAFNNINIPYFFAMFTEDGFYKTFHEQALGLWQNYSIEDSVIQNLSKLCKDMSKQIDNDNEEEFDSLLVLLDYLKDSFRIKGQWKFLQDYEQFQIVEDILMNATLKQFLDRVKDRVIISTIHAAKGLEWEYTVTSFSDPCISYYTGLPNLSLINVGLSRASKDAKLLITSTQQQNNSFIQNISG